MPTHAAHKKSVKHMMSVGKKKMPMKQRGGKLIDTPPRERPLRDQQGRRNRLVGPTTVDVSRLRAPIPGSENDWSSGLRPIGPPPLRRLKKGGKAKAKK